MTAELDILNLLLDRYERSGHCLPGKRSNRRVVLSLSRGEYPPYRENDPRTPEINAAVERLTAERLVTSAWRKGYEGWLLDKVFLNLDSLPQIYTRTGRTSIADTADLLCQLLRQAKAQIQTPWKLRFLDEELSRIEKNLRPSRLLSGAMEQVKGILTVLQYTEEGPELMRVISVNCFHDSKYLERNLLLSLSSIVRAYDPELANYRTADEELLSQSAALAQLGILTYPEIFEFCGSVQLFFAQSTLDTSPFPKGFCLQSENLDGLLKIGLDDIHTVLFVENRTNYRHILLRGVPAHQLVILHGGFYSPTRRQLFKLLSSGLTASAKVAFWGDIDLGGFLMFTRLKQFVFPALEPYRMGLEDYCAYRNSGSARSAAYLASLQKHMEQGAFDPVFTPVARAILEDGRTIEQEIMLSNHTNCY